MTAAVQRVTERDMLDLLNLRYGQVRRLDGRPPLPRWARAEHVRSHPGHAAPRCADLITMDLYPGDFHGSRLALHGHEVKVSRADWLTELRDPTKAGEFLPFMDYWWLVVSDRAIVHDGELPEGWGLLTKSGARLRVAVSAPRREALPLPKTMLACLLRATAKTAVRLGS